MPTVSIGLETSVLFEIEQIVKRKQAESPEAKITRNGVLRHLIQRGMEYSALLGQGYEIELRVPGKEGDEEN